MTRNRAPRILLAKPGCDIHERGALTIATCLRDAGMEVIYTGRYQTPAGIANVAMTEDVDLVALSDHTGSLPIIAEQLLRELEAIGCTDIPLVAGGLLAPQDITELEAMGVTGNYGPGTPLEVIIEHIRRVAASRVRAL